ncbi:hypothetical protein RYX36_030881 [Vicia faba]
MNFITLVHLVSSSILSQIKSKEINGYTKYAKKKRKRENPFSQVGQMKPGTSGHTLIAKVLYSKTVFQEGLRPSSSSSSRDIIRPTLISECLIGGETDSIIFTTHNDQVELMKAGNTVIIHNVKIDMFKGSMRLVVDKWGG